MRRVQLFEASTAYQIMVLAAAIDGGLFAPADERVLLVTVNRPIPEIALAPHEAPGIAPLLGRFDRVLSLNAVLAPVHPAAFRPRTADLPLLERLLLGALGVPEDAAVELVVESVQAPPARSLLLVLGSAEITVHAEGLMSYGPTREPLPPAAGSRIRRLLHLDLVPGLRPLLLAEHGVEPVAIPDDAFRAVVHEVARAAPIAPLPPEPYALVLGQYLAQIGLLPAREEAALTTDLVRAAARRGFEVVLVKPHPSAPRDALAGLAEAVPGVRIEVLRGASPAEALYATRAPALVLGCFSTGLVTATRYWGIPAGTLGTQRVLAALPRFEDSNRIPLAIVGRTVPAADAERTAPPAVAGLQGFVDAIGYCMQWRTRGPWRAEAAAALAQDPSAFRAVVPRGRLRLLGLPGGWPVPVPPAVFERLSARAERLWSLRTAVVRSLRTGRPARRRRSAAAAR